VIETVIGAVGCGADESASTKAKYDLESLVRDLEQRREGASGIADHTDPLIVPRLDAVLTALEEQGPSAINETPRLFYAIVTEEPYPNMMGADLFRIWALVPVTDPVKSVEFRNSDGGTVATAQNWVSAWDVVAEEAEIGTITLALYVTPSVYDPPDAEPSPWVKEGFVPHESHIFPTEGDGYDVVRLPSDWEERSLHAYLVFEDGRESDGAGIWIAPPYEQ
jgi:hypothetical protein